MITKRLRGVLAALAVTAAALAGVSSPAEAEEFQTITDPNQIFEEGYIQVVGYSEAGQSRYRAVRAATVIAQRDLLETFKGLSIEGETTVNNGMLENDRVATRVQGFLRGAEKCGVKYDAQEGHAEVCMRLLLRGRGGAYDVIYPLLKQANLVADAPVVIRPTPVTSQPQGPAAPPAATQPPHDGLVIEMTGLTFKPAIVNRILNDKGEVLFDPSKIVNTILVERGCGGFTNQVDKAKGLLASWGSQSPKVIQAKEARKGTDAVVSKEDAALILNADQEKSYLSQAKVVFVIN